MKPIMRDFPDNFESERLLIRAPRLGDGKGVNEAILESLENLRPWMPWAQETPSPEATEENIRQAAADFLLRKDLRLHIYNKENGNRYN